MKKLYSDFKLCEGPVYIYEINTLVWVDITNCSVHSLNFTSKEKKEFTLPDFVGAIIPYKDEEIVTLCGDSLIYLNIKTGKVGECIKIFDNSELRFNDAKCDEFGNIWAGTMCRVYDVKTSLEKGSLFCIKKDKVVKEYKGFSIPNGMGWIDSTFYHIDTAAKTIFQYDVVNEIELTNKKEYFKLTSSPDGMSIDKNKNFWVSLWGEGKIIGINNKKIVKEICVDTKHTSCISFGSKDYKTMYISSGESEDGKHDGALYELKTEYEGIAPFKYKKK